MTSLFDEHGRLLRLGAKIGEGGEGAVYRLAGHNGQAIKVYTKPLTADRAYKIQLLSGWRQQDINRYTAWPAGLVRDAKGAACGLVLPLIQDGKDVHHLYTPASRRQHFPNATWRFLVHVAANTARAFAAVHEQGLVIGDVNPGSVLVLADGTVRLIDVDSFQVPLPGAGPPLLCTVAVPLFLPPELHHAALDSVVRTPDHDAFGLAVTIFLLLMLGRHPYAGRYLGAGDMPIEQAIAERRFAYGSDAIRRDMRQPPNTVGLEILPPPVARMFESAFASTTGRQTRPTAQEWAHTLDQLGKGLAQCAPNPMHHYPRHLARCPWCAFEQHTSVPPFGVASPSPPQQPKTYDAEYQRLVRLIEAVPAPTPAVPFAPFATATPVTANPEAYRDTLPSTIWLWYVVSAVLVIAGMTLLPIGLLLMACGIPAAIHLGRELRDRWSWIKAYWVARHRRAIAASKLNLANHFIGYHRALHTAETAKRAWQDLSRLRVERERELQRDKHQTQLRRHMQTTLIESASITGIGSRRVATLSAYGIDTAWDITEARLAQVPQFGPKLTHRLVTWRDSVERSFVYNSSSPPSREEIARIERELGGAYQHVLSQLRQSLTDLQAAASAEPPIAATAAQQLAFATTTLGQAEADYRAATGRAPG